MSEADWWLCDSCQSLNSLSARKCYSCRKRKPKRAPRASQLLGYQPIVTRDGKVTLEMRLPSVVLDHIEPKAAVAKPPPLREPTRRDTLAVAPRPPDGARISYRAVEPPPVARAWPPAGPPPVFVAVPIRPGAYMGPPGPVVPRPQPSGVPGRRDAPEPIDIQHVGPWPHWQDLLDVAAPDVARLRGSLAATAAAPASGAGAAGPVSATGLAGAMKSAHSKRAGSGIAAIEWPAVDLAPQPPKSQGG
jgi:hypothetical protein